MSATTATTDAHPEQIEVVQLDITGMSCMACAHRCPKKSVSYPRMNRGKFVPYVHPDIAG